MKWNMIFGSLVLGLALSTQSFGFDLLDRMLGMNYDGCGCAVSCCETADPCCGVENGCDGCAAKSACCDTPIIDAIRCRVCKLKSIRLFDRCQSCSESCCDEPSCGCDNGCEPSCGCDTGCAAKPCKKRCRTPLLDMLRSKCKKKSCCAEPSCGCDNGCEPSCGSEPSCGCDTGCAAKPCKKRCRVSLLDRIFGKRCNKYGCAEPSCGCDNGCEPSCGYEPGCGVEAAPAPAPAAPKKAAAKQATPPAPVVDPSAFLPTKHRFIQTSLVR